ncbi:hypothetical protein D3C80_2020800 [compost metagenome]
MQLVFLGFALDNDNNKALAINTSEMRLHSDADIPYGQGQACAYCSIVCSISISMQSKGQCKQSNYSCD